MIKILLTFTLALIIAASSTPLDAANSFNDTPQRAVQCNMIGKGAAMSVVASRIEGKVLSAQLNKHSNPPVYRVKLITKSGRVRQVMVNACNGQLIG